MGYYTAQICENGHVINTEIERYSDQTANFCPECGEMTMTACDNCKAKIRGTYNYGNMVDYSNYKPPLYCYNCGKEFPWTQKSIEAISEAVELSNSFTTEDKEKLVQDIKNISSENPKTKISAMRILKTAGKFGNDIWEKVVYPVIIDISSETAKKVISGE